MSSRQHTFVSLMALLLLAPTGRWFQAAARGQACACVPAACACEGHEHASGHSPMCAMANGGRCGIRSTDLAFMTFGDQPLPAPTETRPDHPMPVSESSLPPISAMPLRGHSQPLKLPPR